MVSATITTIVVVAAALGDMISPVVVGNVSNMRWFVTFVQHNTELAVVSTFSALSDFITKFRLHNIHVEDCLRLDLVSRLSKQRSRR